MGVIVKLPRPGKSGLEPTEVDELTVGASLGELSLLEKALKPRAATIFCKEDCHFAVLDKQQYQEILGEAEKHRLEKHMEFLGSTPLFQSWPSHSLKPLVYLFKQQKYTHGSIIYNEGEQSTNIFLLREGEVKLTKKIVIKPRKQEEIILDDNCKVCSIEHQPLCKMVEVTPLTLFI